MLLVIAAYASRALERLLLAFDLIGVDLGGFSVFGGARASCPLCRGSRSGWRQYLISNANVITSQVINWSYADQGVRLKLSLQISYQDDPRRAMALMLKAAGEYPRIERTPEPVGRVMGFGESGIDLELRFWITDPADGVQGR